MATPHKIRQAGSAAGPEDQMEDAPTAIGRVNSASTAEAVLHIVEEVLRVGTAAPDDSFYDFGGTSLQAMRICVRIEKRLAVVIKPEVLLDSDRLGDFARSVAELKDA
ncbi:acyl carrier protein [Streptomyces europaeiscabiei]|uniref:acyl carrier protein n=1 Tax=Streptomyces europaeiscabiei TaxID=146819 RepID=UPI0029B2816B|nr:acyl carrier protein [Streptomyces europaeiscabiei]MDX3697439.1 acyl carrier protein [Streptomyces europaeiscabiei]